MSMNELPGWTTLKENLGLLPKVRRTKAQVETHSPNEIEYSDISIPEPEVTQEVDFES